MQDFAATAWRFGTRDMRQAVQALPTRGRALPADTKIQANWDSELADAMRAHGYAIDEEAVAHWLLADLAC